MPTPTEEADWLVQKAFEYASYDAVGAAYAGERNSANGVDALWLLVLEYSLEELERIHDHGLSLAAAFNGVTDEWPHRSRGRLAAYELDQDRDLGSERFRNELGMLAERTEALDIDYEQTTLETYFDPNPFEDEQLSSEEARTVILLRSIDSDFSPELIENVEDFDAFQECLRELGDVEEAFRAHVYGGEIPAELAGRLALPDEWDDLEPGELEGKTCAICDSDFYNVVHHRNGECWVSHTGEVIPVIDFTDNQCQFEARRNNRDVLCSRCEDNWESGVMTLIRVNAGNNVSKIETSNSVIRDHGIGDTPFLPRREAYEIDPVYEEMIEYGPQTLNEMVMIEPNPDVGLRGVQEELLEAIAAGNISVHDITGLFGSGTFYIEDQGLSHGERVSRIYVRREDVEAARAAKTLLEQADDFLRECTGAVAQAA